MKIINLDELEKKCLEFGIKSNFFSNTWNYIEDNSKMPLYMKIAELIGKQSKNGYINASEINQEIQKLL